MERGKSGIARNAGSEISLIRSNLLAKWRLASQALLATLLLLAGASPLAAQGTLGNPDSENLGGRGPGDMVVVRLGTTTYLFMSNFDNKEIVTYRLEVNNALTEVDRTPTCDEPRQLAVTQDNRWLYVACSSEKSVRVYEVLAGPTIATTEVAKSSIGEDSPYRGLQFKGQIAADGQVYDVELQYYTKLGDDIVGPLNGPLIFLTNVDTNEFLVYRIDSKDDFLPYTGPAARERAGLSPHAVKSLRRLYWSHVDFPSLPPAKLTASAKSDPEEVALVAVANSTSNDLTVFHVTREGRLRLVTRSIPVGGSPRALASDPSGRRLYVAVRSTPPAEDVIRTYKVAPSGELTLVGTTLAGRFVTDIEATADRVFLVTVNNQNRDEIRTYRRRGNDLILDSALTTPSQPNFKQITVGPSQGNLTNVFVTEYQGGFIRSIEYTRDNQVACVADAENLCLNGVEVQVDYQASDNLGYGQAVPLTSDTGYFWFFNRDNIELVPKVLDARTVNGSFWVFYGALSNVAYRLRVTDTRTGRVKEYDNPANTLASFADTNAFPAASSGAAAQAMVVAAPEEGSANLAERTLEELYALFVAGQSAQAPASFATCAPGNARLCLSQNRFQVHVDWRVPSQGRSGFGTAVPVTGDTGYFWFFDSANVELIIKVLDARVINGKFWVFYGALSNVEYIITVTDTQTGAQKTYVNPSGTLASTADTSAF